MAANYPRLQLSLPSSATSFKRSFDELGLDLDHENENEVRGNNGEGSSRSPGGTADAGNDRSKRARSESDSSDADELEHLLQSSGSASSSSGSSNGFNSTAHSSTTIGIVPSQQPTIAIDARSPSIPPIPPPETLNTFDEDVQMASPVGPPAVARLPTPATATPNDQLRLSLERFNAFDTNISVLRHSHSPLPAPNLPPLSVSLLDRDELDTPSSSSTLDPSPSFPDLPGPSPISILEVRDVEPTSSALVPSTAGDRPSSRSLSPYFEGHRNWLDRPLSPPRTISSISRAPRDDVSRTAGVSSGARSPVMRRTSPMGMPPAYMQSLLTNLAERTQSLRTATSRLNDTLGEMYMREQLDSAEQSVATTSRTGQEERASRLHSSRAEWDDIPADYDLLRLSDLIPAAPPRREVSEDWLSYSSVEPVPRTSRADGLRSSVSRPPPDDRAVARTRALDAFLGHPWPFTEPEISSPVPAGSSSLRTGDNPRPARTTSRAEQPRRRFRTSFENPSTSDSDSDVELFRQYMERAEAPSARAVDIDRSSSRTDSMRGVFRESPAFRRRSSLGGPNEGISTSTATPFLERVEPPLMRDWTPSTANRNSAHPLMERDRLHTLATDMRGRSNHLYSTRPSPSNSLMSENAAERRRRIARDQVLFPRQPGSSAASQGIRDDVNTRERAGHTNVSRPRQDSDAHVEYEGLYASTGTDTRTERRTRDPVTDLTSESGSDPWSRPQRRLIDEDWYMALQPSTLRSHERLRLAGDEDDDLMGIFGQRPSRDSLGTRVTLPDTSNRPNARSEARTPGPSRSPLGWRRPWYQNVALPYSPPDTSETASTSSSTVRPRSSSVASTARRRNRLEGNSTWTSDDLWTWDDTRWMDDHPFDRPAMERSLHSPEPAVPSSSEAAAMFASGPSMFTHDGATLEANRRNRSSRLATLRGLRADPSLERLTSPIHRPAASSITDSSLAAALHPFGGAEEVHPSRRSEFDLNARAELRSSLDAAGIFRSSARSRTPSPPARPTNVRQESGFSRPADREAPSAATTASDRFYDSIDLDAFHDGPFRASIERSVQLNRRRSARQLEHRHDPPTSQSSGPPSLPPLRFQRDPVSLGPRPRLPSISQMSADEDPGWSDSRAIWPETSFDLADQPNDRSEPALRHALRRPSSTVSRVLPPAAERPRGRESGRQNMDLHSIFTRRPPTEASRIVDDENEEADLRTAQGLRPNGTNLTRQRQLIDDYHRERSEERQRRVEFWGDIHGEDGPSGPTGSVFSNPEALARWRRVIGPRPSGHLAPRTPYVLGSTTPETSPFSARPGDIGTDTRTRRARSPSDSPTRDGERSGNNRFNPRMMRLRAARRRDADFIGGWSSNDILRLGPSRPGSLRSRNLGDYMRDEDLDASYEGLLHLSSLLGEARPRGTPDDVVSSLPSGTYKDWAQPGETEERCPICLDDYQQTDPVLKVPDCSHWFHKGCLEQWLKGAGTCPVCRGRIGQHSHVRRRERPNSITVVDHLVPGPSRNGPNRAARRSGDANTQESRDREEDGNNDDGERTPRLRPRPPWRFD